MVGSVGSRVSPATPWEVVEQVQREEEIHGGRRVLLDVRSLRVPAVDGAPPLAVERTTLPGGPTRPPVVLVHGLAQNRYTWRVSRRSFAGRLAEEGFEVLNLELRGHGLSRRYGSENARTFAEYVDDLSRVAAECRVPPFVIGHSLGGAVALGAATRVPLAGLVHLAGVYRFATRNPTLRLLGRLTLAMEPVLRARPFRVSTGWAGQLVAALYSITDVAGFGAPIAGWAPGSIERDLLEERLAHGFDWTSVEVWLQMARWATGEPFAWGDSFLQLDLPLLVMVGDHDALLRPADVRPLFERSRSHDRTWLLMDAFEHDVHWGHLDLILGRHAPAQSWPRMVSWLADRS